MGDLETNIPEFEVEANIGGTAQTILVKPQETSDGAAYYRCAAAGKEIIEIRQDEKGQWEQLWGQLPQKEVEAIGKAIKEKTST